MTVSNNRFGLFGSATALRNPSTDNPVLFAINARIAAHHQKLLEQASPEIRAKLIHSFHQAKPPTTEKYLKQFIKDFENNNSLADTVKFYRQKLAEYQQAKQLEKDEAVNASLAKQKQIAEAPKITPQALDWQQLIETLKCCINSCATSSTLSWHPDHKENYNLAKLHVLWQRYEKKYDEIILDNFTLNLAHEIAEERKQAMINKHVETRQNLIDNNKIKYSPTRLANLQKKLEHEKETRLTEIDQMIPQFIEYANEVIKFALQPTNESVQEVYNQAIREIKLQQNAVTKSPTLFNKLTASKRYHADELATLKKIPAEEIKTYQAIFTEESAKMDEALDSKTAKIK